MCASICTNSARLVAASSSRAEAFISRSASSPARNSKSWNCCEPSSSPRRDSTSSALNCAAPARASTEAAFQAFSSSATFSRSCLRSSAWSQARALCESSNISRAVPRSCESFFTSHACDTASPASLRQRTDGSELTFLDTESTLRVPCAATLETPTPESSQGPVLQNTFAHSSASLIIMRSLSRYVTRSVVGFMNQPKFNFTLPGVSTDFGCSRKRPGPNNSS
mmetsp:Transcript_25252/g.58840  ORF Transcript_25252/g.58840 Transcript_25252/m.58840 type:complete len:224 (+) Transcript_25252:703-1374(+)